MEQNFRQCEDKELSRTININASWNSNLCFGKP